MAGNRTRRICVAVAVVLVVGSAAACSVKGSVEATGGDANRSSTTSAPRRGSSTTTTTTGRSTPTTPSTGSTAPTQPATGPKVGTCRPATSEAEREAAFETGADVPCDGPHGGEVVATFAIPADVAEGITAEDIESNGPGLAPITETFSKVCTDPIDKAQQAVITVDPAGTPFTSVRQYVILGGSYFLPSPDQWRDGQRWLVCQATSHGPDGAPVPFTGSLADIGHGRLVPAPLVGCVDASGTTVACTGSVWRVIATGIAPGTTAPSADDARGWCTTIAERLGVRTGPERPVETTSAASTSGGGFNVVCLMPGADPLPTA